MAFFNHKNTHRNGSLFFVFYFGLLCFAQTALCAAGSNDQEVIRAAKAFKSVIDSQWENPEVSMAQMERDVHQKFSFEVLKQLYTNRQPIYSQCEMYPIAYSFMIEAPRRRGTVVSEYLVARVLASCELLPMSSSGLLHTLAKQAIEDKVAPYLCHVITHEGFQRNELGELRELANASNNDTIKEIMASL